MFRIIKDGANIGLTENLNYIKQAENGCYVLCPERDASGIVFEGTPYHLLGRDEMEGLETVSLEVTDAGKEITSTSTTGGIMFVTMAEAGTIDPVTAAEHAELFAEWHIPSTTKPAKSGALVKSFTSVCRITLPKRIGHPRILPACGA